MGVAYEKFIEVPCVKTIYTWIEKGILTVETLRNKRRPKHDQRGITPRKHGEKNVALRSEGANNRKEYGHYEIDLVLSSHNSKSCVLTLLERKTRYTYTAVLENKSQLGVDQVIAKIMTLNNLSVKSIIPDNGKEFNGLGLLCKNNSIQYYYCDPYCSTQRGSNEVWHTLLRRWYPKGFDFNRITNIELQETTNIINNIKRKIFNYKSSSELKEELCYDI